MGLLRVPSGTTLLARVLAASLAVIPFVGPKLPIIVAREPLLTAYVLAAPLGTAELARVDTATLARVPFVAP